MPVITEVREHARHPERCSVYVDGAYAFGMGADEALARGLVPGKQLTEEQLAELAGDQEVQRAKEYLFRLLGYRARSESELRTRLRQKQFAPEVADQAVEDLRRLGMIDDQQFADAWVRDRMAAGKAGRARLAWELRARGVDRQVVEKSLAEVGEDADLALATELAQRRYERLRDEEPEAQRRKIASFLQRRGFSYDTIHKALDHTLPPE